jgi:hypothetical protein
MKNEHVNPHNQEKIAHEQELLKRKIAEGLDSPGREMTDKDWAELKKKLKSTFASKRKPKRQRSGELSGAQPQTRL